MSAVRTNTIPFKRRYNFKKVNWKTFSEDLDKKKSIAPMAKNDDLFVDIVEMPFRKHIPRGC